METGIVFSRRIRQLCMERGITVGKQYGWNHGVHYPRHCERRYGKPTRIHAEKTLRCAEHHTFRIF